MKRNLVHLACFVICPLLMNTLAASEASTATSNTLTIARYKDFVNTLDVHDIDSVARARECALNLMPKLSQSARDQVYLNFEKYYFRMLENHRVIPDPDSTQTLATDFAGVLTRHDLQTSVSQVTSHPYYKMLRRNGYGLSGSEGYLYVDQQSNFLKETFASYLSPPIADFLKYRSRELADPWIEDAGLMITFSRVGERVRTWEIYLAYHPDSPYKDEAKELYDTYLGVFMSGIDNTPIFDDNGVLGSRARNAYEDYIKCYPDTITGRLMAKYYGLLKRNHFHDGPAIRTFLEDNHIRTMFNGPER